MTVLVSGGSGLVGSHVIEALVARGDRVRALVRAQSRAAVERLGAEPVVADITDATGWARAAAGARAIIHAAALVAPRLPLERFLEVNVEGTRQAVNAARALGLRLVHISSVAVYGRRAVYENGPGEVDEDFPFAAQSERDFYARSKRAAEAVVREAAAGGGLSAAAVRPDVIYGERDRLFTPRVMKAVRSPLVPLVGDGTNHLACVYAGNVASAVVAVLDAPVPGFRAYNVTHDAPPLLTCREFLDVFGRELGTTVRTMGVPRAVARVAMTGWTRLQRLRDPRAYAGLGGNAISFLEGENPYSPARITEELGWRPPWNGEAAIRRTVQRETRTDAPPGQQHDARDEPRAS